MKPFMTCLFAREVARRTWEEEVKKKRLEAARTAAKELGQIFAGVRTKEIVRAIREDKDTR